MIPSNLENKDYTIRRAFVLSNGQIIFQKDGIADSIIFHITCMFGVKDTEFIKCKTAYFEKTQKIEEESKAEPVKKN